MSAATGSSRTSPEDRLGRLTGAQWQALCYLAANRKRGVTAQFIFNERLSQEKENWLAPFAEFLDLAQTEATLKALVALDLAYSVKKHTGAYHRNKPVNVDTFYPTDNYFKWLSIFSKKTVYMNKDEIRRQIALLAVSQIDPNLLGDGAFKNDAILETNMEELTSFLSGISFVPLDRVAESIQSWVQLWKVKDLPLGHIVTDNQGDAVFDRVGEGDEVDYQVARKLISVFVRAYIPVAEEEEDEEISGTTRVNLLLTRNFQPDEKNYGEFLPKS